MSLSVLHISTPDSWRGGEQQLAYLLQELQSHGVTQHVLCRKGGAMAKFCAKQGIDFTEEERFRTIGLAWPKQIAKLIEEKDSSLIHTHDSHAHTAAVMSSFFGVQTPIVVSRRVDFPVGKSLISKWKYNHKRVVRILCVSNAINEIVREGVDRPERVRTVYSGIDLSRFEGVTTSGMLHEKYGFDRNKPVVGVVAALAPHKDLFTWIRAAKEVRALRKDVQFIILGDGPLRNEITSFRDQQGMKDVVIAGFEPDIVDMLPCFDVFMFSSETEGLGTSILDAFACGVPVVATRAGGIPELVIDGVTGRLVDVKDYQSLASRVVELLDDEDEAERLEQGAQEHLNSFTYQATAHSTLAVYEEVEQIIESTKRS